MHVVREAKEDEEDFESLWFTTTTRWADPQSHATSSSGAHIASAVFITSDEPRQASLLQHSALSYTDHKTCAKSKTVNISNIPANALNVLMYLTNMIKIPQPLIIYPYFEGNRAFTSLNIRRLKILFNDRIRSLRNNINVILLYLI